MQKQILLLLLFFLPFWSPAQVLINEVCTDNEESIEDEYGEASDWIELFNAGSVSVNLSAYLF